MKFYKKDTIYPGFNVKKTGVETYEIYGGKILSFNLFNKDKLEIIDVEGCQNAFIIAFDESGNGYDLSKVTNLVSNVYSLQSITTIAPLAQNNIKEFFIKNDFASEGIGSYLFKKEAEAGSISSIISNTKLTCLLIAEGNNMLPDKQNTPTKLEIKIIRDKKNSDKNSLLPKALAEIANEYYIKNSTAVAYTVKKGEYIQVIDIDGQQCSDFQAFNVEDVKNGKYLCLDATTTRTLMASSYPQPGVHGKYYNKDQVALVEIIHDTVSKHDNFGLACNAKYYEDRGYPGHINCTENFNNSLNIFSIPKRTGWEALNLFFNTNIEENQYLSDESWSRPGDYVILKALVDLICVSSACPDDTTPSNGWQPSDVYVRIYKKNSNFKKAVAFRPTTKSNPIMTIETGFHSKTSQLTRDFSEYKGYWLANEYNQYGAINEYWACRKQAAIMDLSPLRKFEILGQDAEKLMQYTLTRNISKLAIGQIVYSAMCYENGCMIDDGTLFRLCSNNFRWVCGSDYCGVWLRKIAKEQNMNVFIKSSTDQLHNIALQGPKSRDIIRKVLWTQPLQPTIDELKWFRFTIGRMFDEKGIPIIVSRTGYTGELGYEIWCHPKEAANIWQIIWDAGKEYGVVPLGLTALDMLRIEAGLVFADYEFCDQTDPFEAGIGFSVPLKTKESDFIGKEKLIERKNNPQEKLVGLELQTEELANHGDGVFLDRQQIGVITSGTRSPILKKNIALSRVSCFYGEIGDIVEVGKLDGHQKRIPAKVVRFPFYDPEKLIVRS